MTNLQPERLKAIRNHTWRADAFARACRTAIEMGKASAAYVLADAAAHHRRLALALMGVEV